MLDEEHCEWAFGDGLVRRESEQSGVGHTLPRHTGQACSSRPSRGASALLRQALRAACRFLGREPVLRGSPSRDGPQHHHRGTHALTFSQAQHLEPPHMLPGPRLLAGSSPVLRLPPPGPTNHGNCRWKLLETLSDWLAFWI